jgi:hypothetical protein
MDSLVSSSDSAIAQMPGSLVSNKRPVSSVHEHVISCFIQSLREEDLFSEKRGRTFEIEASTIERKLPRVTVAHFFCMMKGKKPAPAAKQAPKTVAKKVAQEYGPRQICCFDDVLDRFSPEYRFTDCPLSSFDGVTRLSSLKTLKITNGLLASFKGAGLLSATAQARKSISLGGPVTRHPLYRTMLILALGDTVDVIDDIPVSAEEKERIKRIDKDGRIAAFVRSGGILRTFDETTPETIAVREKPVPKIAGLESAIPADTAFSEFLTPDCIRDREVLNIETNPVNSDLPEQIVIQSQFASFGVLFNDLDSDTKLSEWFTRFTEISSQIPRRQQYASLFEGIDAVPALLTKAADEITKFIASCTQILQSCRTAVSSCALSKFCGQFLQTSQQFYSLLTTTPVTDIDELLAHLGKAFSEIIDDRTPPFGAVIKIIQQGLSEKGQVPAAEGKLRVMSRFPTRAGFQTVADILKSADSQRFATEIGLCETTDQIFNDIVAWFTKPANPRAIVLRIEDIRRETVVQLTTIWNSQLRPAFTAVVKAAATVETARAPLKEDLRRLGDLSTWLRESQEYLSANDVIGRHCTDLSLYGADFAHLAVDDKSMEVAARIAELQQSITHVDSDLAALKK